jgi:chorismate synthase
MTNGEDLVIRAALKPISTLRRPLRTVDLATHRPARALVERSDVCMVPAAAVVVEAAVALELARAWAEKFGGDSLGEMRRNHRGYLKALRAS